MSSRSNRPDASRFLTGVLLAGSLFVTGSSLSAQVERRVRTETVPVRLAAEGYDMPATQDFELSNPVELAGVCCLVVDTFVLTIDRQGTGLDGINIRFELLAGGVEVLRAQGLVLQTNGSTGGGAVRSNRDIEPTDRVADSFRVSIWASRIEPGGRVATVSVFPLADELRLHFVKGARGVHERTTVAGAVWQSLAGPGTTGWQEYSFDEPVAAAQLKLVKGPFFDFSFDRANGSSECQLILDAAPGDPDRYMTLDDAFSPSQGVPSAGWFNSGHSLLLDTDTRVRLLDRSIVGFRWRVHQIGGGSVSIGPGGEVSLDFYYDDRDCDGDGLTDIEELAQGTAVDEDPGDGVPDDCGEVPFQRGDANDDAATDLTDAIFVLAYLFTGGDEPSCLDAADANDDGAVDLSDGVYVLNYLFLGGAKPIAPFVECGTDPTSDELPCESFGPCER